MQTHYSFSFSWMSVWLGTEKGHRNIKMHEHFQDNFSIFQMGQQTWIMSEIAKWQRQDLVWIFFATCEITFLPLDFFFCAFLLKSVRKRRDLVKKQNGFCYDLYQWWRTCRRKSDTNMTYAEKSDGKKNFRVNNNNGYIHGVPSSAEKTPTNESKDSLLILFELSFHFEITSHLSSCCILQFFDIFNCLLLIHPFVWSTEAYCMCVRVCVIQFNSKSLLKSN